MTGNPTGVGIGVLWAHIVVRVYVFLPARLRWALVVGGLVFVAVFIVTALPLRLVLDDDSANVIALVVAAIIGMCAAWSRYRRRR